MDTNLPASLVVSKPAVAVRRNGVLGAIANYLEVLKPLPSALLAFIGFAAAVIAGDGFHSPRLALVFVTVLIAAAGANGLTNYLDRFIDARLRRTCLRVLP